ncbi:apoptosis facilitator Bcl-2-like protein 14 [Trichomycterus rosablanca]|uniref:apoptosis facilitator Bcl-2-like protein 14 n=1 Tax=Trichomycterus rosablanca TaxID=2290929 RepID=UPI002F360547
MEDESLQATTDETKGNANISKDSIEYRLLLAYTQKKGTAHILIPEKNGVEKAKDISTKEPQNRPKSKKKRKLKFWKLISCVRPAKNDDIPEEENQRRCAAADSCSDEDHVEDVVEALTKITDTFDLISDGIETDSDDIVEKIVQILREEGDKLNAKIESDKALKKELQASMSYILFECVIQTFTGRLSPEVRSPAQSPKKNEIALTCEVISRLNALDSHPMNRVLGFGAKYMHDYFSPWVNAHGGYEKVFDSDDTEEEVQ